MSIDTTSVDTAAEAAADRDRLISLSTTSPAPPDPSPRATSVASASRAPAPVAPHRLLAKARAAAPDEVRRVGWGQRGARRMLHALLGRMAVDRLTICERLDGRSSLDHTFGPGGALDAVITVHDRRAYSAVLAEGSVGFGRGFVEGWWTSDDPVTVVRVIIRNLAPLDDLRNRVHRSTGWLTDRVRALLPRDSRERNRDDIGAHYDIGNAFFELFLDETMTYSSAVFPSPDSSLADASRHKYDRLLAKLGVSSEHHLLEIGTGWGGMAIRAAETTGCRVTTTTISTEQLAEARLRVHAAGLRDRVTLLDRDWRDLEGVHDRVVSIEMIEAVDWRDYDDYFARIERCLAPDGLAAIQAICLPDQRWARAKNTEDFIRRFVFPNGFLPSVGAIAESVSRSTRMHLVDVEDLTPHYAETLRRWRERFDERLDEVAALGLDARFQRLWRFYLAYCEAGFLERHCTVVHVLLAGRDWRGDLTTSTRRSSS